MQPRRLKVTILVVCPRSRIRVGQLLPFGCPENAGGNVCFGIRRDVSALLADFHCGAGGPKALSTSQNLIRANGEASTRCGEDSSSAALSAITNIDSPSICTDTLIASFNSLMSAEISLLFKINSLFPILGNFGKKLRRLLRFLTLWTSNYARNRCISLYFPCRSGNSTQRLVSQETAPSAMESANCRRSPGPLRRPFSTHGVLVRSGGARASFDLGF